MRSSLDQPHRESSIGIVLNTTEPAPARRIWLQSQPQARELVEPARTLQNQSTGSWKKKAGLLANQ
jgi:hypothetical protein